MELTLETLAKFAYDAVVSGHWWLLAAVVVLFLVWALREYGGRLPFVGPKLAPLLAHPVVAWSLPTVLASLSALVVAIASGLPLGAALLAAVKVAAGAVFAFVGAKKVAEARTLGAAAAAEVTDDASAAAVLRGPQP
jgi:hypothetical protein